MFGLIKKIIILSAIIFVAVKVYGRPVAVQWQKRTDAVQPVQHQRPRAIRLSQPVTRQLHFKPIEFKRLPIEQQTQEKLFSPQEAMHSYPARWMKAIRQWFARQWVAHTDPHRVDQFGRTALLRTTSPEMTEALIAAGANVNHVDQFDHNALVYAQSPAQVKALIDAGADINHTDQHGNTPLFNSLAEKAQLLIDAGADINAVNAVGMTPLFHANEQTTQVLVNAGANVNHADHKGQTPLFHASSKIAPVLLNGGANVNHVDKRGATALDYAKAPALETVLIAAGGKYSKDL